ncbi:PREDICTED: transcription factor bHLH94-like [Nelumbo nucifera]|uniref:Transcription factor bHLH94-like n=1 Tax=Nelumbo nucifera TaxID=4432 RepID=A0A1U8AXY4_NELNU|nr:PREDICTED: transcription factor bHLH94-like [Nelumbo nucifera]
MALEALSSNDLSNFITYDALCSAQHYSHAPPLDTSSVDDKIISDGVNKSLHFGRFRPPELHPTSEESSPMIRRNLLALETADGRPNSATTTQGRKKRRRRPKVCKNKEEAETQRMTHIAVERNRRKQMNEHLAVLRSLMPESYIQRGDQASIVGGAIEFVKELEQLLQFLEVQKRLLQQKGPLKSSSSNNSINFFPPPFSQFFTYPQYSWCQAPREYPQENRSSVADIEVTLIETHANLRVLTQRRPRQLLKMVLGFQTLRLTILHLNVSTLDSFVLYSFSVKVEEGCHLTSVDDIASAVHHMLRMINDEAALAC